MDTTFLGDGGYGKVYRVTHKGDDCAVKVIHGERGARAAHHEVRMHRLSHGHAHVIRLLDAIIEPFSAHIFLQYGGRMSLLDHITQETWGCRSRPRVKVLHQLASAMSHIHKHNVVHMDLKPENVLISDCNVDDAPHARLIDFGLASEFGRRRAFRCGTYGFCAPEVCSGTYVCKGSIDVWSFGITAVALFHGRIPFLTANANECVPFATYVHRQWSGRTPTDSINASYDDSPFVWGHVDGIVVDACLIQNPSRRVSMDSLERTLRDCSTGEDEKMAV